MGTGVQLVLPAACYDGAPMLIPLRSDIYIYICNDIYIIIHIYTHIIWVIINIHICHYVNINVQYDATYDALSLYI